MKYVAVALALAALAGLEFLNEFASRDGSVAMLCIDPARQPDSMRELLVQHLHPH